MSFGLVDGCGLVVGLEIGVDELNEAVEIFRGHLSFFSVFFRLPV